MPGPDRVDGGDARRPHPNRAGRGLSTADDLGDDRRRHRPQRDRCPLARTRRPDRTRRRQRDHGPSASRHRGHRRSRRVRDARAPSASPASSTTTVAARSAARSSCDRAPSPPTPINPTGTWSSARTQKPTPDHGCRSWPTTCAAPTEPPSAASTTMHSSTCAAGASPSTRHGRCSSARSSATSPTRSASVTPHPCRGDHRREQRHGCDRSRADAMSPWSPIELTRDCTATTVPRGEQVALAAGGLVEIVQRLGGSVTVRTEMGSLLRLDGADADVLGLEVVNDVSAGTATGGSSSLASPTRCRASTTPRSRSASSSSVSSTAARRFHARTAPGESRSTCP